MFGATTMAKKRPQKNTDAATGKKEVANVRVYWEQCDLINELADAGRCSVAQAVERYLDGPLREAVRKLYSDKLKSFDAEKSKRSTTE